MKVNFAAYAQTHDSFCRVFLSEKLAPSSVPQRETHRSENNEIKMIINENPKENLNESPKASRKLSHYRAIIKRALKNGKKAEPIPNHSNQNRIDIQQLNPILLGNLKKFCKKIRANSHLNDLSGVGSHELHLIDDQTHFSSPQKNFNFLADIFLHLCQKYLTKGKEFPLINPYGKKKLFWDFFISIIVIFFLFYIPCSLSFGLDVIDDQSKMVCSILLITDMVLEMNSLHFKHGIEVRSRKKIIKKYLRSSFVPDAISDVAFLIYSADETKNPIGILGFLFFMKIFGLIKFGRKITNRFQMKHEWKCLKNLAILFSIIIFIAHLVACGWYFVGVSEAAISSESWIKEIELSKQEWLTKYLWSLYWASVTVMTVGYGDITPKNSGERIYSIVVILLGGMILPFTITSIGNIFQDLQREKKKFDDTVDIMNEYMRRKKINMNLQTRIREYLHYIWREEKTQNFEEESKIINSLSTSLKEQLKLETYGTFLKKNTMFTTFFSEQSLKCLGSVMEEVFMTPDDIIFHVIYFNLFSFDNNSKEKRKK